MIGVNPTVSLAMVRAWNLTKVHLSSDDYTDSSMTGVNPTVSLAMAHAWALTAAHYSSDDYTQSSMTGVTTTALVAKTQCEAPQWPFKAVYMQLNLCSTAS